MRATWSAAVVVPFALFTGACGPGDRSAAESTELMSAPSHDSMAGANNAIGVMSRNLYLGADLGPVIAARSGDDFVTATTAVWLMVKNNDFRTRARALAAEIAATRPALIGLQEAVTWQTRSKEGVKVPFDYVPDLLQALAASGSAYREVARVDLLDVAAPTALGLEIRLMDHEAILAREDVQVTKSEGAVFKSLLTVPTLVGPITLPRGYVSVEVNWRGEELRFVSTHLESFHRGVRAAQASELATVLAAEKRPVILVGDLNSEPGVVGDGEAILAGAGFEDVWAALHPNPGLTCCFLENLRLIPHAKLSQRIDYVLTRGPLEPLSAVVLGAHASTRVGGLWPSDHAGVFAEVRIADRDGRDR